MTAAEKARKLVNDNFYQPITIHLNVNNNSKEMWEYAKYCALTCVEEIISQLDMMVNPNFCIFANDRGDKVYGYDVSEYWYEVKEEIEKL